MKSVKGKIVKYLILFLYFSFVLACEKTIAPTYDSFFDSYKEIPGITAEEIDAIEALRTQYSHFVYAVDHTTEAFPVYSGQGDTSDNGGAVGGYAALFCEWLTMLFDIPFIPTLYEDDWDRLLPEFASGRVHFMGDLMPTEERRETFYMTGTIAERSLKAYQIASGNSITEIAKSRQPRLAFPQHFAPYNNVIETAEYIFEPVFIDNFSKAYQLLKSGEVDALVAMNISEPAIYRHGDVVSETFFPLVFASASLSTRRADLKPIISVVQKAIENGGRSYLAKLYAQGQNDYIKNELFKRLTADELDYIQGKPIVKVMAETDNYPISFYNHNENEFQGLALDLIRELELLTGLSFEVTNAQYSTFTSGAEVLEKGEVSMITELGQYTGREGRFLWSKIPIMRDYSILISKTEFPDIHFYELGNAKVGIVRGTAHSILFKRWFPNNASYREYENSDKVFNALERGEVDMMIARANYLLSMENYKEHAGYKANVIFDNYFDCFFGYNKDETTLCTIVDKALDLIHREAMWTQWTDKRFDYRAKMTAARLPWLIGATTLLLIVMSLMFLMFWRQRQEGRRLELLVGERTEELNKQNSLMSTVNAAAAILIEPETEGGIDIIGSSMEMICQSLDADSVYLWQNVRKEDGILYYKQVCKWGRAGYVVEDEGHEYSYEDSIPVWNTLFSEGNSLNGPIDTLPENEQEFLSIYKVQSILAVPLFLEGALWGFVNFNDCHSRRFFPEADEHVLRSWSMLVMGAILRGEILQDLKNATDEAKNASEAKSHFVANMSHEIRTPMNVIVGLTDLLLEEETPGKTRDALEKINTAGKTLMELISNVLDMSKIEAGKLELTPVRYDVASLLNDIITLNMIRIEEKPVKFVLNIDGELPAYLFGDNLRVKQILNNLLSNAFKYTKEGTVILSINSMSVGRRQKDDMRISFSVSDTGVGIRKEDMAKLFTDYNQVDTLANREIEGTGLGLSITKKFIELMDGEILVESEYGKGTTFNIRIRQGFVNSEIINKETVESLCNLRYSDKKKPVQEKLIRPNLSDVRVLVVDDFPANLDVAAGMLRKYKMHVDCVTNGKDAINLIAAHEPIYNAIFMDHMMPVMDGMEATKKIRALGTLYAENIPIIALTANVVAGNEQMFLENGFNAFLPKPFSVMTLDAIIQQWVREKRNVE